MFLRSLPTLMCLGIVSACAEDRRPEPRPAGTADAAASGPAVLGPTGPLPGATNVPLEPGHPSRLEVEAEARGRSDLLVRERGAACGGA